MGKIVVTFKLEDGIYSKLKEIAEKEGRGISEIMRESLTDWLQNKKHISMPDFITFLKTFPHHRALTLWAGNS